MTPDQKMILNTFKKLNKINLNNTPTVKFFKLLKQKLDMDTEIMFSYEMKQKIISCINVTFSNEANDDEFLEELSSEIFNCIVKITNELKYTFGDDFIIKNISGIVIKI